MRTWCYFNLCARTLTNLPKTSETAIFFRTGVCSNFDVWAK